MEPSPSSISIRHLPGLAALPIQCDYPPRRSHFPCEETSGATELIIRSADGVLRRCRNLCLSAMLEAVRASAGRTIDIDVVNRVLLQPHWQNQVDLTDF